MAIRKSDFLTPGYAGCMNFRYKFLLNNTLINIISYLFYEKITNEEEKLPIDRFVVFYCFHVFMYIGNGKTLRKTGMAEG